MSEQKLEIYSGRNQAFEKEQKRLFNWLGSQENKNLIQRYQTYLFAKKTGKLRVSKLTYQLRNICDWLKKDLSLAEKQDLERVIAEINQNSKYSVITQADYRKAIKSFYNWYEEEDKRLEGNTDEIRTARNLYKYLHKEIRTKFKEHNIDYSELITEEDFQTLLNEGCSYVYEKAIISLLFETGIRVGELLGMRIKDIEFKEKHGLIRVDGKTGVRVVPISQSIPYLLRWITDEHPDRNNKNAYLWLSKQNKYYGKPLKYPGIRKLLTRVYEKAGYIEREKPTIEQIQKKLKPKIKTLKKRINPHWFRHTRATYNARDYREEVLNKIMGWTQGSKMTKTYVHLNSEVVEEEFKKLNGLIEEKEKKAPKTLYCVCGAINTSNSKYCFKCGKPLSIGVIIEDEQKKNDAITEAFNLFAEIMSNPELKAKFEEFKTNGGAKK